MKPPDEYQNTTGGYLDNFGKSGELISTAAHIVKTDNILRQISKKTS